MTASPPRLKVFDSLSTLADYVRGRPYHKGGNLAFHRVSFTAAVQSCRTGLLDFVAQSDRYLAALEALEFSRPRPRWLDAPAGFVPNVPAYLAGHPASMRRRVREPSTHTPITIVVNTAISYMYSQTALIERGAVILALVRLLADRRPLTLYAGYFGGDTQRPLGVAVRLDTAPLDLAHATFALCAPEFMRWIMHSAKDATWPGSRYHVATSAEFAHVASPLAPNGMRALLIDGTSCDWGGAVKPQDWIVERLRELNEEEGEAA